MIGLHRFSIVCCFYCVNINGQSNLVKGDIAHLGAFGSPILEEGEAVALGVSDGTIRKRYGSFL